MPDLPEITILAQQMDHELAGRRFCGVEVIQPKSLNMPVEDFEARVVDQRVERAYAHGKWIITATSDGFVLINLGMGGEVLLRPGRHDLPEKYRLILDLEGGECVAINFWWFGSVHSERVSRCVQESSTVSALSSIRGGIDDLPG